MKIDSAKIILLHPGKTGGTSIEHLLRDMYMSGHKLDAGASNRDIMFGLDDELKIYLQHVCLRTYKAFNIPFKEYKTIATVRRPYERILSCYFYNGKSEHYSFETFVMEHLESCVSFSLRRQYAVGHFAPQHFFTHIDDYIVDHIIKLENFEQDCKAAGLPVKYHYSQTEGVKKHKDRMSVFYNDHMKEKVYSLYKEDFDLLGYSYD